MKYFIWSLIFACVWVVVTGAFTLPNLALGMAFGAASLFIIRGQPGLSSTTAQWRWPSLKRLLRVGSLIRLFVYELMMSAIKVAGLVLSPNMNLKSGIFAYETALTQDSHIMLLSNLITLTPGTLTVDVSDDRRTLFIHAVDCSDIEATSADIRNGFERKIREAFCDPV